MIVIRCHECNRKYNWAGDAFCPHCGAFNQAEDYSFDRERIEVVLEESDEPRKPLFQRKKTSTGIENNAPTVVSTMERPPSGGARKSHEYTPQKIGCLQKVIIAVIAWNVLMAVMAVLFQSIAEVF